MQALETGRYCGRGREPRPPVYIYSDPSPFPPIFADNPWAYGFGLFGTVVAAALALTLLLSYLFETRRAHAVQTLTGSWAINHPANIAWSPLFLYRGAIIGLLTFVVMRALPDAIWMLAWGEVSDSTIRTILACSLVSHGLATIPLIFAVLCSGMGRQVIPQMLVVEARAGVTGGPPWQHFYRKGRIVLVVLVIAIGVTIGKASA
jgi:hypothetical protein